MEKYIPEIETNQFPMNFARKFVKRGKVMAFRFGKAGWSALLHEFKETQANPTTLYLDRLVAALKQEGYDELQISRWIFEEAVDRLVAIQLKLVTHTVKKYGKVPKWIFLPDNINKYID